MQTVAIAISLAMLSIGAAEAQEVEFTEAPGGWELLGVPVEEGDVAIANWASLSPEESQLLREFGATFGRTALRAVGTRLFGSYSPANHDALKLAGDPMDRWTWSGEIATDGAGTPVDYQIFDVVEAPLPATTLHELGNAGLRGG